ncbi:sigma-70 family RNA polymerase sigma factor [Cellulosimicrobium terreum]|nr:sigma-70 family RNA polymerase sigma factor [Cellulosimicrobium terreum]
MSTLGGAATADALASTVAAERGALVATLIRLTGDWELAEDCVQDATEKALARWPVDGVPRRPGAWLTTVARRRALDVLRRRRTERSVVQEAALLGHTSTPAADAPGSDDLLRLIYTCCHPALPLEARVALTLRTVAGLTTDQIARAFLVPEATMSQRLLRARRKIEHAGIPYRVPPDDLLHERTNGVLAVVYLIFNEGYGRAEDHVSDEALRLAGLLADLAPRDPEVHGLLALVTFQQARRDTRFDGAGDLVPMEEQDRARWDRRMIDDGQRHLRRATGALAGEPPGGYLLQARIAACHATSADAASTPWGEVVTHYDALLAMRPSPVVALNRAVAVGFRDGFAAGLAVLATIDGLDHYALLHAARADFLDRLGRTDDAHAAYVRACGLSAVGSPEHRFLERRAGALGRQV